MASGWQPFAVGAYRFTAPLRALFDDDDVRVLLPEGAPFSRRRADGLILLDGTVSGRRAGVVICDFRVNGGSFGSENSARLCEFVEAMASEGAPVLARFDTIGVRFTEGRTVFARTFELVVAFSKLAERSLLVTAVDGQCLGLGAVLFALGHYRLAVEKKLLNLTGPEVFTMFFKAEVDFEDVAAVERHQKKTALVHELVPSTEALYAKTRLLFDVSRAGAPSSSPFPRDEAPSLAPPLEPKTRALLAAVFDESHEVFAGTNPAVRTFIARRTGRPVGVLMNPPGRVDNLITTRTLARYEAALRLFDALELPVISFLDTPGVDPRAEETDRNVIGALVDVAKRIVGYRHRTLGVAVGRCFGGAAILSLPKNLGGTRYVALADARIGIMDPRIIDRLLAGSERMSREWRAVSEAEPDDMSDLIAAGLVDRVIESSELRQEVDRFLVV